LEVQHQILQRSLEEYRRNIWFQALTYGHFNLHDSSLIDRPIGGHASFLDYCFETNIVAMAAAPLSMGLLTSNGPPIWHPASSELRQACRDVRAICEENGVDVSTLALLWALPNPRIPCTILGMSRVEEVSAAQAVAMRFQDVPMNLTQEQILAQVLTEAEQTVMNKLRDATSGPFASVWKSGLYRWDGVQQAHEFWRQLPEKEYVRWQVPGTIDDR
jgi:predicted oxidoreductase